MGALLLELLPIALGLAITPTAIAATILLLGSRRPVASALLFAAPFAVIYSVVAAIDLSAANASAEPLIDARTKHWIGFGMGLFLLAIAAMTYFRGRRALSPQEPRWMTVIESASPRAALGFGTVVAVLNPNVPILVAGLAVVTAADVSSEDRAAGTIFLIIASLAGMIGPVLWYLSSRQAAMKGLARLRAWLSRHQRAVNTSVLVVFGLLFTIKGAVGVAQ